MFCRRPPNALSTHEGDAGRQEKNPHQQVFKLLYHQLPQGLAWGRARREVPGDYNPKDEGLWLRMGLGPEPSLP